MPNTNEKTNSRHLADDRRLCREVAQAAPRPAIISKDGFNLRVRAGDIALVERVVPLSPQARLLRHLDLALVARGAEHGVEPWFGICGLGFRV